MALPLLIPGRQMIRIMEDKKDIEKKASKAAKAAPKKDNKKFEEKIAALEGQVEELEESVRKEKDDYMRLMAEFETFRRRSAEDRLTLVSTAAEKTVEGLLPILDDFERALAALEDRPDDDPAKQGTQLIYNKLFAYLKAQGLAVIEARGAAFDTDFHEAVAQFPVSDEALKGKVYDVVQTGYTFGGKVLRYAKVVVGA